MEPTGATWLTLLVIGGFIWGGFAVALTLAVRSEGRKGVAEPPPAD